MLLLNQLSIDIYMKANAMPRKLAIKKGDVFHNFTVVDVMKKWQKTRWRTFYVCECICGTQIYRTGAELKNKNNDRCHTCYSKSITSIAVASVKVGDRFADWEVVGVPFKKNTKKYVDCRCNKCGICKPVDLYSLSFGKTNSCVRCSRIRDSGISQRLQDNFGDVSVPQGLVGKKIGKRLILDFVFKKGGAHYKTQCECGLISFVRQARIQNLEATTCKNCMQSEIIEVGTIVGKRKILSIDVINGEKIYSAICECGNKTSTRLRVLQERRACKSCAQRKFGPIRKAIIGHSDKGVTRTWHAIFDRCYNIKHVAYSDYGGRGIKVHPRYFDMQNFVDDLGPRPSKDHSVDRIEPDGDYAPGNIRWATNKEQMENRRCSKKYKGLYITVKKEDLCKKCLEKFKY